MEKEDGFEVDVLVLFELDEDSTVLLVFGVVDDASECDSLLVADEFAEDFGWLGGGIADRRLSIEICVTKEGDRMFDKLGMIDVDEGFAMLLGFNEVEDVAD